MQEKGGVSVSNAAGYSTNGVTELVFGLAIGLYRYMITCDERSRSGSTKDGLQGRGALWKDLWCGRHRRHRKEGGHDSQGLWL